MIIIMKPEAIERDIQSLVKELKEGYHVDVQVNTGTQCTVLGVLGDTHAIDKEKLLMEPNVDRVMPVQEPYKKASRKFHPDDSVIDCGGVPVGGGKIAVIAGPCSVENVGQITEVATEVKRHGASLLRGGAYKPRTSPYSFQGLEMEGLRLLLEAKKETGLPIVTEIMSPKLVEKFDECVDVIQVGARNMQNFDLLKELGKTRKPILLKRGLSSTIEELLMSAEYILASGNPNVILCERGVRTFETYTRNTLDVSIVPVIKKLSHLPIIIDPSHAAGMAWLVEPLSMAAVAAGADGIMVEVHNNPQKALCDGQQSITPDQFGTLMQKLHPIADVVGRTI